MSYIRLHPDVKERLEYLAGDDYTMNDLIRMLIEDFIEVDDDDDDDPLQTSLFDEDFED